MKKVAGGSTTVYIFSGFKVIAEYLNGSLNKEYVYSGSQLLATLEGGATKYHHADHLSPRLTTDASGTVVAQRGHFPFGEAWYETGATEKWKFTSYEQDSESGLDYAVFRYDSSRLGRFLTPDPLAGSIANPQSLNRYAYTLNDPVNLIDPLGLLTINFIECNLFTERCTTFSIHIPDIFLDRTPIPAPFNPCENFTDPAIRQACNAVSNILKAHAECAEFFNAADFFKGKDTNAADTFSDVFITRENGPGRITSEGPPRSARTVGTGQDATIILNKNGAFFRTQAMRPGVGPKNLTVGAPRYQGRSLEARTTILLHEFAHAIKHQDIPSDDETAKGREQSSENTKTILEHCRDEIEKAAEAANGGTT